MNEQNEKTGLRRCHTCGRELEVAEFGRDRSSADGLSRRCKACQREAMARSRIARHAIQSVFEEKQRPVAMLAPEAGSPLKEAAAEELKEGIRERVAELIARGYAVYGGLTIADVTRIV